MTDSLTAAHQSSRAVRRSIALGAVAMVLMGSVLLYMLMQATNNRELYEQNYARLFVVNVVVAALLLAAIVWALAPGAVWQPLAGQTGNHLCVGRLRTWSDDLCGVLPVRLPFH
jgi:protein-S-isoprenylcysteine O-methyltransferase Ste14